MMKKERSKRAPNLSSFEGEFHEFLLIFRLSNKVVDVIGDLLHGRNGLVQEGVIGMSFRCVTLDF